MEKFEIPPLKWWNKVSKNTYHSAEFGSAAIFKKEANEEYYDYEEHFDTWIASESLETSFINSPLENTVDTAGYSITNTYEAYIAKIEFLRKIVALEKQAQIAEKAGKKDEAARLYMQMANGFYHTKLWQYNTHLWENHKVATHEMLPYQLNWKTIAQATEMQNRYDYFGKVYACQYWAAILYQKAALTATDRQLIAENLYGQAAALRECNHAWRYENMLSASEKHLAISYENAIHKLLENYQDTEVLDSLLGKCPILREYQVQ